MDWASITVWFISLGAGFLAGAWFERWRQRARATHQFAAPRPPEDPLKSLWRYMEGIDARLDALISQMGYKLTYQEPQRIAGRWVVELADVESPSTPEEPTEPTA